MIETNPPMFGHIVGRVESTGNRKVGDLIIEAVLFRFISGSYWNHSVFLSDVINLSKTFKC